MDEEDKEEISVVQEYRGDNLATYIQSQRGKFDTQIEVDGKFYSKASIYSSSRLELIVHFNVQKFLQCRVLLGTFLNHYIHCKGDF